jgi:hypothetical protein
MEARYNMKESLITFKTRGKNGKFKTAKSMSVNELKNMLEVIPQIPEPQPKRPWYVSKKLWNVIYEHGYGVGHDNACRFMNNHIAKVIDKLVK